MPYPGLLHPEPLPCGRPLLTHTPAGNTQTQFCLSLCGVPRFWCTQGMFEHCEHLWQVWGLILNVISPLLPSCWGFSFALAGGGSPQSHPSAEQPWSQMFIRNQLLKYNMYLKVKNESLQWQFM